MPDGALSVLVVTLVLLAASQQALSQPCLQKILPPSDIQELSHPQADAAFFGGKVIAVNEVELVVLASQVKFAYPAFEPKGAIFVYYRAGGDPSAEFELAQMIGNETEMAITRIIAAMDDWLVFDLMNITSTFTIRTVYRRDSISGQYAPHQVLGGPDRGFRTGTMCHDWIISDFIVSGGPTGADAFKLNRDTELWEYHSRIGTDDYPLATNQFTVLSMDRDCNFLVTNGPIFTGLENTLQVYTLNSTNFWTLHQSIPTVPQSIMPTFTAIAVAVTSTHFAVGFRTDTYNMTAANERTNFANVTHVENAGSVYAYVYDSEIGQFNYSQVLFQPKPQEGASCGYAVAAMNSTLLVGCPRYNWSISFADDCALQPGYCNESLCVQTGPFITDVRGLVDQYELDPDTDLFEYEGTRSEVCNSSLPFACAHDNLGYGLSVSTYGDRSYVGSADYFFLGQVYAYTETLLCDQCPCITDPPCEHGGVCQDVPPASFHCTCHTNYTGERCEHTSTDTASSESGVNGWQIALIVLSGVLVVVIIIAAALSCYK